MLRGSLARVLLLVPIALVAFTAGCLSLGGKTSTTHVHDNPETAGKIASLEARVSELEAALGRNGGASVGAHDGPPVSGVRLP